MTTYRDYTFLGTTQSLCPDCLALVPAKIISRNERVYFRKTCPTHGPRDDFVCSDVSWFDRNGYNLPGKVPVSFGTEPQHGCPYDCGLCSEHEQHTCIGLLEITSNCNLECPMCFAVSGPGGKHLTFDECRNAIDRLVEVEGQPEILQLSGGEPTVHPEFHEIHQYACDQPIDIVMINTNGVRLARDAAFLERVASLKHRTEIYLQFDGFSDDGYQVLRGESLLETKLQAVERLGDAGLNTILVCTVQPGVNDHELGRIVEFGMQRPWVTGVSFQPATYSGRFVLPEQLEQRITFPDVIHAVAEQTDGVWRETDFSPLPCAHPNGHTLAYAFRAENRVLPLARFVDLANHLDLLSGRITFNRQRAQELIAEYLSRQPCGAGGCPPDESTAHDRQGIAGDNLSEDEIELAQQFFMKAMTQQLNASDMFRITTTSFMDAWNFDVRQLMKSCVHFLLPSGHVIPFSAYNVLYRDGHAPLPPLLTPDLVTC
jgi:7,8-dihydro-6-hydroxymethylpterin dimethyltransferase